MELLIASDRLGTIAPGVAPRTNRDLDAMLALQDENVVSHPSRLFGHRSHTGHAGVRAWWAAMEAAALVPERERAA